jgi:hypothetical protein
MWLGVPCGRLGAGTAAARLLAARVAAALAALALALAFRAAPLIFSASLCAVSGSPLRMASVTGEGVVWSPFHLATKSAFIVWLTDEWPE